MVEWSSDVSYDLGLLPGFPSSNFSYSGRSWSTTLSVATRSGVITLFLMIENPGIKLAILEQG